MFQVEKCTISRFGFINKLLGTFFDETVTDSDIDFNILVEILTAVRSKTADTSSELSQNNHTLFVAIKACFMNEDEIDEIRNGIIQLEQQVH